MALQTKHVSEEKEKTPGSMIRSYTLYGTKAEVDEWLDANPLGSIDIEIGYALDTAKAKITAGGDIWELDLGFAQLTDSQGYPTVSTSNKPSSHSLTTRMISIPLEGLKASYWGAKYRTKWNYALAALKGSAVPEWWTTATSLIIPDENIGTYAWISNENDVANMPKKDGVSWGIICDKTKPGVEAFYFPVNEITEIGKHKNESDAAWIAATDAGTISVPSMGTFGISGGTWLNMGGSVQYDGKNWVATVTYQRSPDGWDTDLYKT